MIPYTAQENEYLSSGSYRRSNRNKQRRIKHETQVDCARIVQDRITELL